MNDFLRKIKVFSLFTFDLTLLYSSLALALYLRYGNLNAELWHQHWPIFTGLFIIWVIVFYAFNLYESTSGQDKTEFLLNYPRAIISNIIIAILYFYLLAPKTNIAPKTILIILIAVFTVIFFIFRKLINPLMDSRKLSQNLLFIGYEPLIEELMPASGKTNRFGYNFKGMVNDKTIENLNLPYYPFIELEKVLKKEKIDLIVVNEPNNKEVITHLFQTLPMRVNFTSLTNFYEQTLNRIPLAIISHGWFLDNLAEGNKQAFEFIKRLSDIVISAFFGLISFILMPFIITAIAINSRGPILFKQIRIGKDNKPFLALKFRSMYQNAESNGPMWATENDPRITDVGKFLRTTRLDEIPQLWNILKGEMSFVGPRPERPEFIETLIKEVPFYKERLLVKPGLTGWAQIKMPYADSVESSLKKLQYDLYYIKHRSLFFDLSVILKTINTVLKKIGR